MHPQFWQQIIFYGKVVGATGTIITMLLATLRWAVPKIPLVVKVNETNDKVQLLLTNHYPHLQESLNAQDRVLGGIHSEVKLLDTKLEGVCTRLEDTRNSMHTLGESFIRHIDSVQEIKAPRKKSNASRKFRAASRDGNS